MITGTGMLPRRTDPVAATSSVPFGAPVVADPVVAALREALRLAEAGLLPLHADADRGLRARVELADVHCVVTVETAVDGPAGDGLSPREREIAHLVARCATNRMIASVLEISAWTVSTHLRRIFAKLDVTSRAEMVAALVGAPAAAGPERRRRAP